MLWKSFLLSAKQDLIRNSYLYLVIFIFLYPATQKVAGYYVMHSENFECPSVRLSIRLSALHFRSWPIFFNLCMDIDTGGGGGGGRRSGLGLQMG